MRRTRDPKPPNPGFSAVAGSWDSNVFLLFCLLVVETVEEAPVGPENPKQHLRLPASAVLQSGLDAPVLEPKWLSPGCQGDRLISCAPPQAVVLLAVVNVVKQQRCVCVCVHLGVRPCLCCSCQHRRVVRLTAPPRCRGS